MTKLYTPSLNPEIWNPPEECFIEKRAWLKKNLIEGYLKAKRCYYDPNNPEVDKSDEWTDPRFDYVENAIKRQWTDHPCLGLVGWNDEYMKFVSVQDETISKEISNEMDEFRS